MRAFQSARGLTSRGEVVNLVDIEVRDQRWRLVATNPEQQPHPHASGHTEARVMRSSLAALSERIRHTCPDAPDRGAVGRTVRREVLCVHGASRTMPPLTGG